MIGDWPLRLQAKGWMAVTTERGAVLWQHPDYPNETFTLSEAWVTQNQLELNLYIKERDG